MHSCRVRYSNHRTTGILERSNAEGKLRKNSAIPQDSVAEVRGTWCTKNDTRALSPVGARGVKMAIRKHQSSEKCIYYQTPLFVPSLRLLLERL